MITRRIEAVWRFISLTPTWFALLVLLFIALCAALIWQAGLSKRGRCMVFITMSGFGLADWLLFSLLPILHLSYGPVGLSLFSFILIRFMVFLCCFLLSSRREKKRQVSSGRPGMPRNLIAIWLLNLGISLCQIYGYYYEPFNVQVTRLSVSSPKPLSSIPVRIVQLSDLHIERMTRREERIITEVKMLKPDLIFLTGDFLNTSFLHDELAKKELVYFLNSLEAKMGIYAVISHRVDRPETVKVISSIPKLTLLDTATRKIHLDKGLLGLIGVSHHIDYRRDKGVLTNLVQQIPQEAYTILLYHSPDIMDAAVLYKIDLYLCGHTHGGQIRLPYYGAIVSLPRYYKKYEMGGYKEKDTFLYVNRGLGMEGLGSPRVRFLCPPEILVIDLQ